LGGSPAPTLIRLLPGLNFPMKKITLKSSFILLILLLAGGFIGEKFQSVELVKSSDESPRFIRTTWWGLKTEELKVGSGEWKAAGE
jgi:hypothetical protein